MKDFPKPDCWMAHRVSYGETDCMSVLYYAEYLHLFERSRSEFIRNQGMSYTEVEAQGVFLPVREAQCRYRAPARYDDLVHIHVAIASWGRASVKFIYELWNEDKTKLLAEGMTEHAMINAEGRPVPVPTWLKELWEKVD